MNVLVACEESQRVCTAFREKGHNAFSCDILPCSGGHPEWHIHGDVLPLLNGHCGWYSQAGLYNYLDAKWDLIIAHPPCTYLTLAGNKWFNPEFADGLAELHKNPGKYKPYEAKNGWGTVEGTKRFFNQILEDWERFRKEYGDEIVNVTTFWIE